MKCSVVVLCAALLLPCAVVAGQAEPTGMPSTSSGNNGKRDWWEEINRAADSCHGGWDVNIDVSTGYSMRTLGNEARSGPFAEARITVPLFSKRDRQRQAMEKGKFLEHGAGLIQELWEAEARIAVKLEQAEVLRQVMIQEGLEGIQAYFRMREEIAGLEAKVVAAELKLRGFVDACAKGKQSGEKIITPFNDRPRSMPVVDEPVIAASEQAPPKGRAAAIGQTAPPWVTTLPRLPEVFPDSNAFYDDGLWINTKPIPAFNILTDAAARQRVVKEVADVGGDRTHRKR